MIDLSTIRAVDPELTVSLEDELKRQQNNIELIASENIVSPAVLAAMGTHLTNKYAEGYPAKRYYGGCEFVDVSETLAIERAKKIFGAEHANVQAHSGANANLAVYFALVKPNDTILGMSLAHGGHLTHGSPVNISGKYFNFEAYGVEKDTQVIDYDKVLAKAKECKPKLIVAGASAYPRTLDFKKFKEIADEVGALFMVDMAHIAGLVAAGLHPNPVPYADVVTTTTHKTLRGPRGGLILCREEYAKAIDKAIFPGTQGGPLMHIIAAKAVSFLEAMKPDFITYQKQIIANANAMANRLIANGVGLVSGGTDNHLMLLDLTSKNLTGKVLEKQLDLAHITVNKNSIPFDKETPFVTSGIRIGTPAITTRGMVEEDAVLIADLITKIIDNGEAAIEEVSNKVSKLCAKYPIYSKDIL